MLRHSTYVRVFAVGLHVSGSGPRIGVDQFQAARLRLLRQPNLVVVGAIPLVLWCPCR